MLSEDECSIPSFKCVCGCKDIRLARDWLGWVVYCPECGLGYREDILSLTEDIFDGWERIVKE